MKRILNTLSRNWPKYLIEAIVIVASILGAFILDNWHQTRKENLQEQILLNDLRGEFEDTRKKIKNVINSQQYVIDYIATLLEIYQSNGEGFDPTTDSLGMLLSRGPLNSYRIEPVVGTYESILGSGSLNLIKDLDLKRFMANFYSEVSQGFEDHDLSILLLVQLNDELHPCWSGDYMFNKIEVDTSENNEEALRQTRNEQFPIFLKNDHFFSNVIYRGSCEKNRIRWQQSLLRDVDKILEQLNKNIH